MSWSRRFDESIPRGSHGLCVTRYLVCLIFCAPTKTGTADKGDRNISERARGQKKFARAKLAETPYVSAGTINPHLPKRTIASTQIPKWLEERDEDDLA
jgi:hypothetical protein